MDKSGRKKSSITKNSISSSGIVEVNASNANLSFKDKLGDAANDWIARNRSLSLRQTPIWAQSLTLLLICLGSISLVASIFFRIEEVVTTQGQLKSIGGTVDVKTPVGGKILTVHFKDGQVVKKGQLLLEFDTRQAMQDIKTYTSLLQRENSQLQVRKDSLESQKKSYLSRKAVLIQQLETKKVMLNEMKNLVDAGGYQKMKFLEKRDQAFGLENQINDVDQQITRLDLGFENSRLQSLKSIEQMKNSIARSELQLQYQNVVAPIDGIIFNPSVSADSVVGAGDSLLSLVSQSGLFAEVFIPNKDIGYIKNGQDTAVRVDAFPFARYGEIKGVVSQVSADALPPSPNREYYSFPVKIDLKRDYLGSNSNQIPLKPGMSISANLRLRDKPLISLVSDIFIEQADSVKSIRQQ